MRQGVPPIRRALFSRGVREIRGARLPGSALCPTAPRSGWFGLCVSAASVFSFCAPCRRPLLRRVRKVCGNGLNSETPGLPAAKASHHAEARRPGCWLCGLCALCVEIFMRQGNRPGSRILPHAEYAKPICRSADGPSAPKHTQRTQSQIAGLPVGINLTRSTRSSPS